MSGREQAGIGAPPAPAAGRGGGEFRYPRSALTGGCLRAAVGLAVTAVPLFLADPDAVVAGLLAAAAMLFAVYGIRTVLRGVGRVRIDDDGIASLGPLTVSVPWAEMRGLKLGYYSTNRERTGGWMQLNVKGRRRTLRVESTLEGFSRVVGRAVDEATLRGIELSPTTRDNLRPLGVAAGEARDLDGANGRPPHG